MGPGASTTTPGGGTGTTIVYGGNGGTIVVRTVETVRVYGATQSNSSGGGYTVTSNGNTSVLAYTGSRSMRPIGLALMFVSMGAAMVAMRTPDAED